MKHKTAIQALGLLTIMVQTAVLAFDGVPVETVVILTLGVVAIVAPESLEQLNLPGTK